MYHFGLHAAYGAWQVGYIGQGRGRDFQRQPRQSWQGAAHGNERPAGTDVQSRGKLQDFLTGLVAGANENGDCQRQPLPATALFFGFLARHEAPSSDN